MSDLKQAYDGDVLDLDKSMGENSVQDLYSDADLAELEDFDGFNDEGSDSSVEKKKEKKSNVKFWLALTLLSFGLALLVAALIVPAVNVQKQRVDLSNEAISKVSVSNLAAGQAMTEVGQFDPVKRAISDAEGAINRLVGASGVSGSTAQLLFGNKSSDQEVVAAWTSYKAASEQFMANSDDVTDIKKKLFAMNGRLGRAVGDSVVFVESVAKEGRNKGSGASKDKYLFLTSEASNLNGILSRLGGSTSAYFTPDANLPQLADAQNGLMVRLQETLNRIVSNSAAVVGTAAEPLRAQYSDLESRILEIGDRASSVAEARTGLNQMRDQGRKLSETLQAASVQGGNLSFISNLATLLPCPVALFSSSCESNINS